MQREEEAAGEHHKSHSVQHERQEVHSHRRTQDQPVAAGLHQRPIWLHPGRPRKLKYGPMKAAPADFKPGCDVDVCFFSAESCWYSDFVVSSFGGGRR